MAGLGDAQLPRPPPRHPPSHQTDLRPGRLSGAHLQNLAEGGRAFCRQKLGAEGLEVTLSFALTIIEAKVVSRELLLGLAKKKSLKNCQSSNGSSSSSYVLTEDRCFGKRSSEPMAFCKLSRPLRFFGFLTIFRLFDDLSTAPLLPPSTSSYLTITWAALVDESVDALVLSLEVSVYHHDHHYHRHHHQPRLRPYRVLL